MQNCYYEVATIIMLLMQEGKMRIFIVTKDIKENGIIVKQKKK
jgi:hypothetical protein